MILPARIEQQVSLIADKYYNLIGESIVITSGRRSYLRQAELMYGLRIGRGKFGNYKAKDVIDLLEETFNKGQKANKAGSKIIQEMEKIISSHAKRGIYISTHIIDGAVDVKSHGMSPEQLEAFKIAATGIATYVVLEFNPYHWHIQF